MRKIKEVLRLQARSMSNRLLFAVVLAEQQLLSICAVQLLPGWCGHCHQG